MESGNLFDAFGIPTTIYYGRGAVGSLADVLIEQGLMRALVVTDVDLADKAPVRGVASVLEEGNIEVAIAAYAMPDPTTTLVAKTFAVAERYRPNVVVAVGGGSSIDLAKAVSILLTNGGNISDYSTPNSVGREPQALVAIPTTAGTGSEVSRSLNVTDPDSKTKLSIRSWNNRARFAFLDSELLRTLPHSQAVYPALDALTHAVESYVSRSATPLTQACSQEAFALVVRNVRPFLESRDNSDAGMNMLFGACLAGVGFTHAGTGYAHCIARCLGGEYRVPHGLLCGIALPHIVQFNASVKGDQYRRLGLIGLASQADVVVELAEWIAALMATLEVPTRLRDVGVTRKALGHIARKCSALGFEKWNPRPASTKEFGILLDAMW